MRISVKNCKTCKRYCIHTLIAVTIIRTGRTVFSQNHTQVFLKFLLYKSIKVFFIFFYTYLDVFNTNSFSVMNFAALLGSTNESL